MAFIRRVLWHSDKARGRRTVYLLKLARCTGNKSATDFVDDILFAYADILKRCGENGVEWLQVDEPYLVMDLTMGDAALFRKLYQTLLEQKGTVKVPVPNLFWRCAGLLPAAM